MLQLKYLALPVICSFLLSCSSGGEECSIPAQNQLVHELLVDDYLWYRDIPAELPADLSYSDFASPDRMLDYLRVDADRFSNITDAAEFESLFNQGQLVRYGFTFFINADDTVQIKFVFDDSPAGKAGLERGDYILSINNQTVEQISASFDWAGIFGPNVEGYPVDLLVRKKNGDSFNLHLEKSVVNINTVLHHSIITNGNDTVGYLVFNSFITPSIAELFNVFSDFKAAGVNKMILDLRYNGGGSVSVAQYLASLMVVTQSPTDLFTVLKHNDKHQDRNTEFLFKTVQNELDLQQVTVITTGSTASASEMVINGLKPFVEVKTVGSTTFGKPVGMNPSEFCGKIILPITFAGFNQNGEGDFFGGFAADCAAQDDLDFSFGDIQDPMLSEALFVSQTSSCSSLKAARKINSSQRPATSYFLQDMLSVH